MQLCLLLTQSQAGHGQGPITPSAHQWSTDPGTEQDKCLGLVGVLPSRLALLDLIPLPSSHPLVVSLEG